MSSTLILFLLWDTVLVVPSSIPHQTLERPKQFRETQWWGRLRHNSPQSRTCTHNTVNTTLVCFPRNTIKLSVGWYYNISKCPINCKLSCSASSRIHSSYSMCLKSVYTFVILIVHAITLQYWSILYKYLWLQSGDGSLLCCGVFLYSNQGSKDRWCHVLYRL